MTKSQINAINTKLCIDQDKDNRMGYTALVNNYFILASETCMLYSDVSRWRYKFDASHELIERAQVRLYSHDVNIVPNHGNYDVYNNNGQLCVYEYFFDSAENKIVTDYFAYDSVILYVPRAIQLKSEDIL